MKIITVKHKITGKDNAKEYFEKLAEAAELKPDVIFGPDYGVTSFHPDGIIDFSDRSNYEGNLARISSYSPETLIVPGTWPILVGDSGMSHAAPIYRGGKQIANFLKQTNVENSGLAEDNGLVWQRGSYDGNSIMHQGKKIAVEICSDHGKQPVAKDTFLELILARDTRAGFYVGAANDNFTRYAIVNDSNKPMVEGFKYDPKSHPKMSFVSEQKLNSFLTQFILK